MKKTIYIDTLKKTLLGLAVSLSLVATIAFFIGESKHVATILFAVLAGVLLEGTKLYARITVQHNNVFYKSINYLVYSALVVVGIISCLAALKSTQTSQDMKAYVAEQRASVEILRQLVKEDLKHNYRKRALNTELQIQAIQQDIKKAKQQSGESILQSPAHTIATVFQVQEDKALNTLALFFSVLLEMLIFFLSQPLQLKEISNSPVRRFKATPHATPLSVVGSNTSKNSQPSAAEPVAHIATFEPKTQLKLVHSGVQQAARFNHTGSSNTPFTGSTKNHPGSTKASSSKGYSQVQMNPRFKTLSTNKPACTQVQAVPHPLNPGSNEALGSTKCQVQKNRVQENPGSKANGQMRHKQHNRVDMLKKQIQNSIADSKKVKAIREYKKEFHAGSDLIRAALRQLVTSGVLEKQGRRYQVAA